MNAAVVCVLAALQLPLATGPEPIRAAPFFFAVSVADVEASAAWYESVLGFRPYRASELDDRGIRIQLLRDDGALLEIVQAEAARAPSDTGGIFLTRGIFKIGFRVADLEDAISRLRALEVPLRGRVVVEPDGSMRSVQIEDPDGNVVQLFELAGDGS